MTETWDRVHIVDLTRGVHPFGGVVRMTNGVEDSILRTPMME